MRKQHLTSLCFCYAALALAGCASSVSDECSGSMESCNDVCVDISSTVEHCGACDNNCKGAANVADATCTNSTCAITTCVNGYADCDKDPANGCEKYIGSGTCEGTPVETCEPPKTQCPAGCLDLTNDKNNCGACGNSCSNKGNVTDAACENSACKIVACATNYADCDKDPANGCEKYIGNGTCEAPEKQPDPITPSDCQFTITYTHADTCAATGGSQDWNVYLMGEMNEWAPTNPNYAMNAGENCARSVTFNVEDGKTYKFKYYIDGWGENAYHSDEANAVDDDKNNQFTATCGGSLSYTEKAPVTEPGKDPGTDPGTDPGKDPGTDPGKDPGTDPGTDPNPGTKGCEATFTYYNQYTNTATGGSADFDVYLVGSFNADEDGTWKTTDEKFKMTSDGKGTHTITVDLEKDKEYEYKYYVNGWDTDSWKTDAENGYDNGIAKMDTCGKSFGTTKPDTPVVPEEPGKCFATFIYTNKYTSKASGGTADFDVYLTGSMNEWAPTDAKYKMTSDGNGTHTISVELKQGEKYTYKYYVNGWEGDAYRANSNACSDQDCNSLADMTTCGQIFKFVEVPVGGNDPQGPDTPVNPPANTDNCYLKSVPTVDGKNISFEIACKDTSSEITEIKGGKAPKKDGLKVTDTVDENNKYTYTVKIGDNEVYVPVWVEDKAFDWHDALLYFAFTDRFVNGDKGNDEPKTNASEAGTSNAKWLGGDFKGMLQKVEEGYFDKLGVNTLWISSVTMNAQGISWGANGDTHSYSAYHSYWPVAAFYTDAIAAEFNGATSEGQKIVPIEPHFGSVEDLKNLVDACHKRGIRVLVDFAANHVHKDSPIINKHPDWINDKDNPTLCDTNNCGGSCWDKKPETCWFSQDLPDINYNNAAARKAMVDHAIWLIKATNVDGFRVDAVKHMNIQFVKDLRAATDKLFANTGSMFYMVGETFTGDVNLLNKYIGNDLLHAQFDFPMYYALQSHVLGLGNYASVAQLNNRYNSDLMGTFMGNHDVARAISVAAKQNQNKWGNNAEVTDWLPYLKMKTAWTILLTNPGVPLIYYGDEYGMEGANDPDNRRMMEFGDTLNSEQKSMLDYVQKLGQIRKEHKAITRGHRENLSYGGGYWCYKLTDGSETIIVGVARADGGDNAGCDLKGSYNLYNLLSDEHETQNGVSRLDLSNNRLQVYQVK